MEETQREVREELARRGSITSNTAMPSNTSQSKREEQDTEDATTKNNQNQEGIQNDGYEVEVEVKQTHVAMDQVNKNATASDINNDIALDITNEPEVENTPTCSEPDNTIQKETSEEAEAKTEKKKKKHTVNWTDNVIDNSCRENSWFGKKCLKIFKLFINCFSMTFIAEWGDRSQLATIVLAGINDV